MAAKRSSKFDTQVLPVSPEDVPINGRDQEFQQARNMQQLGDTAAGIWSQPTVKCKTKIVCTIGPSTDTREMIWKLAEASMNVARMNKWDGMMSFAVKSKIEDSVKCEVVDSGDLKSRRHLNVRRKSATLPSITDKDWDDIKFGLGNKVDFYAVSFVKDAKVVHKLKDYLKGCGADIHVIVIIESADSIPNLHSMITASDGRRYWAELPIEEEEIIRQCRNQGKAVTVATYMLEIAVREGADAVMLSGEAAHGNNYWFCLYTFHNTMMNNILLASLIESLHCSLLDGRIVAFSPIFVERYVATCP
ncbi:hypothetical protein MKX03_005707, partial [Papaver bracteatum]